jgi:type VI secretion system protein ImpK
MTNTEALAAMRSNSLGLAFQDCITVILRVRYRVQRVADVASFRDSIRKMVAAGAQETRRLGYSDATVQMALYCVIGFLDESVLSSQDPTFQGWARQPLQEEMFGGHFAGEYFFRHVNDLLNANESSEVADALELHAIALLLGYKGKYAFGDSGEIYGILQRIRLKIQRIRGPLALCRVAEAPTVAAPSNKDVWVRRLLLITGAMAALVLVAFIGYWILLANGLNKVQAFMHLPALASQSSSLLASFIGGLAR